MHKYPLFHFQVFFARPILWGLTYDGQKGAEEVLDIVISEFDNAMALSGIFHLCIYYYDYYNRFCMKYNKCNFELFFFYKTPCYFTKLKFEMNWFCLGCSSIDKIEKDMVVHESEFYKF